MEQISAPELAALLAAEHELDILDVREPWEWQINKLPNSIHIPMGQITGRFDELCKDRKIVCLCHHGVRSLQVAMFLKHQGFNEVLNLQGGIDAWSRQVDNNCPTY